MNTYIRVLVFSSFIVSASKGICSEAPLSYHELGSIYLKSYGELPQEEPDKSTTNKPSFEIADKTEAEQLMQLCQIMAECPFGYPDSHMPFYKTVRLMLRDFEILYGSADNPDCTILNQLDRTHTLCGKVGLMRLLSQPLSDRLCLERRQEFIRYLVDHEDLLAELEALLTEFKETERYILALWDKPDAITSDYLDNNLYFGKWLNKLNGSPAMLELRTRLIHLVLGGSSGFTWVLPFIGIPISHYAKQVEPRSFKKSLIATRDLFRNAPTMIKDLWELRSSNPQIALGFKVAGIYAVGFLGLNMWSTYQTYCLFRDQKNASSSLQDHLCRASRGLRAADVMGHVVQDLDALDILPSWTFLVESEPDQELDQLRTNTFAGGSSYFSYIGRVLAMSRDKESISAAMVPVLQAVGELDAYVSCAKLYKEYEGNNATISFVEFFESTKPYIQACGVWHPFIAPDCVVKNDIRFGKEYRTMILTGSNTGGKSTLLKSIGLNLLLAQTCGLCFADAMAITPFHLLSSSLNISDNTAQGISLFKAEVLRARDINSWIDQLCPSEYGFVLVDELFNGTNSTSGSKAACRFAEDIAMNHPNVLTIFATHFPQITELKSHHKDLFANYMMDVKRNGDGAITHPFKLELGVSTVDIAQDLIDE